MKHEQINQSESQPENLLKRAWRLPSEYYPLSRPERGSVGISGAAGSTGQSRPCLMEVSGAAVMIRDREVTAFPISGVENGLCSGSQCHLDGGRAGTFDLLRCVMESGKYWMVPLVGIVLLVASFVRVLLPGKWAGSALPH